jgi:dihydrofolate reductase
MRKVIMWNLVTLDGFFEGPKSWDIGWHEYVWGDELERISLEQAKSIGMLLFGRVTYQGMAGFWQSQKGEIADFMNEVPKVVFSRTLPKAEWNNSRLVKDKAEQEVIRLKKQPGKDLFIFGSADLSSAFTRAGLIDEYRLCVAPVVLGSGNPLFKASPDQLRMKLLEARPLKSGGVILRYQADGTK